MKIVEFWRSGGIGEKYFYPTAHRSRVRRHLSGIPPCHFQATDRHHAPWHARWCDHHLIHALSWCGRPCSGWPWARCCP